MRSALEFLGSLGYLLGDTMAAMPRRCSRSCGRRLGWANLWGQMNRVGVNSIPIVSLVLFCIGAILAFQMAPTLVPFGMLNMLGDLISVAVFRELGPLVSAIVLTGVCGGGDRGGEWGRWWCRRKSKPPEARDRSAGAISGGGRGCWRRWS